MINRSGGRDQSLRHDPREATIPGENFQRKDPKNQEKRGFGAPGAFQTPPKSMKLAPINRFSSKSAGSDMKILTFGVWGPN